jgi:hypothetical protein
VDKAAFIRAGLRFLPGIDRIENRVPCLTLVVFRIGRDTFYGTSGNLSSQGMFIAYEGAVEVDDQVRISFLVPGSNGEVVEARGRVAWLNSGKPICKPALPRGFGVEFTDIQGDGAECIARFIARARETGGEPQVEGAYLGEAFF